MKKILVCSGKGGVGKTTISVVLSRILNDCGYKVGILDVDIDTPNVPEFMNVIDRDVCLSDIGIVPKNIDGIEMMSVGLMADSGIAVMWGGDRRAMAIDQMINKVDWSCEALIIDSPPGTTDEVMTVIKKFNPDGIIIVTTNHKASIADVKRTLSMIKILESSKRVIGIVKNMTYITCAHCGNETTLFENGVDEEIDRLVIAELPYTTDDRVIKELLKGAVDRITEVL